MAIYRDAEGQLVESDDEPERLAEAGYAPATQHDIERHDSRLDYEESSVLDQVAETGAVALKSGIRTAEAGLSAIGLDTGIHRDEQGNPVDNAAAPETLFSPEDRYATERHPIAETVGQAAVVAPAGIALSGAGAVAGVLGEAAAGGYAAEAENAWLEDRDFSQEAAFTNVAGGLLIGGGIVGLSAAGSKVAKLGRNLFTEAEHAAGERAARDLLDEVPTGTKGIDADEIARRGPDDAGVAYLRDNADEIADDLATKQAKAAQELLDTYGEMAPLRQRPSEVAELIPDAPTEQARWIVEARKQIDPALEGLPSEVASPLRERLTKLGEGSNPARWFTEASELSDDLLRARAKAVRAATDDAPTAELAEQLTQARETLDAGLRNERLWGKAAEVEGQRSAGYAQRYGEHIDSFEAEFTTLVGGARRTDPAKFRAILDGSATPEGARALERTIDSARVTADVAAKFGRKEESARILGAIDAMERIQRQGAAVQAARKTASRETADPVKSAMEWLTRESSKMIVEEGVETAFKGGGALLGGMVGGAPGMAAGWLGGRYLSKKLGDAVVTGVSNAAAEAAAGRLAARGGVFRAAQAFALTAKHANKAGVQRLLSRPVEALDRASSMLRVSAPRAALVSALSFDAHRDHVDKLARDPSYFGEVMAASFGTMPEAAPEVFSALSQQAAKTVRYLAAVAPGGSTGGPFAQRIPVSEDELWEYNERLRAIADPEYIRDELAAGSLSAAAVETFEVMNPKQYAQLQMDVFERLQELKSQGIQVPLQAREQLDTALNLDGGGEAGLTWKVAERAYAATARRNGSSSGQVDASEHAGAMTSGALNTLGNGASAIAQTG